jgi:hypothetical protein
MNAPKAAVPDDAAREAQRQAEVQALADRVRQLQDDVAAARRDAAAQAEYRAAQAPPAVPYAGDWLPPPVQYVNVAPPPVQYVNVAPPPIGPACDPSWIGCGLWWTPGVYPAGVVFVRAPAFRRPHPVHGSRPFPAQQPVRAPGGGRVR